MQLDASHGAHVCVVVALTETGNLFVEDHVDVI